MRENIKRLGHLCTASTRFEPTLKDEFVGPFWLRWFCRVLEALLPRFTWGILFEAKPSSISDSTHRNDTNLLRFYWMYGEWVWYVHLEKIIEKNKNRFNRESNSDYWTWTRTHTPSLSTVKFCPQSSWLKLPSRLGSTHLETPHLGSLQLTHGRRFCCLKLSLSETKNTRPARTASTKRKF